MLCMIQGQCSAIHVGNLKYTVMHQEQYLVQPTNTQENLNIERSKKIWKMEGDGSLGPPPRLPDKGAY